MDGHARREKSEEAEGEVTEDDGGEMRDGLVVLGGTAAMTAVAEGWWTPLLMAE